MKILDIALKDLTQSFRSLFAVGMMFAAPLLITGLIYFAFGGLAGGEGGNDLPDLNIVIVNHDRPTGDNPRLGELLVGYLQEESMPDWLVAREMQDETTARAAVDQREAGVALIVPADFSDALLSADHPASLTLVQDPTLSIGPAVLADLVRLFVDGISGARIASEVISEQVQQAGVAVNSADLQDATAAYAAWYAELQRNLHHSGQPILAVRRPAAGGQASEDPIKTILGATMAGMVIFFNFFTGASAAQSILREQEEGTLARLFTTPAPRALILLGKFSAVFVMVFVQAVVLLAASALIFGINWGRPATVVLLVFSLSLASTGFGILLLSGMQSLRQSGPVIGGVISGMGMMGGLFTAGMANLPKAFNTVTLFVPQGWAMRGWKLALAGAAPAEVLLTVLVLAGMGLAFFAIGAALFRRRLA